MLFLIVIGGICDPMDLGPLDYIQDAFASAEKSRSLLSAFYRGEKGCYIARS